MFGHNCFYVPKASAESYHKADYYFGTICDLPELNAGDVFIDKNNPDMGAVITENINIVDDFTIIKFEIF